MPRKGPKKITARDEADIQRRAEAVKTASAELKKGKTDKLLHTYDVTSLPVMPDVKSDCRLLRAGLKERGETLLRHGETEFKRDDVMAPSENYGHNTAGNSRGAGSCNDHYFDDA